MSTPQPLEGVLLLHHHFPMANAPTIREHVAAFGRHSRFPVFAVNTELGFPPALHAMRFRVVVLHYSLFGGAHYFVPDRFCRYLEADRSYKIAFFQDEHRYCRKRFAFIDRYQVDAVYTLLEPPYHAEVYGRCASVKTIRTNLPGYVSDELVDRARRATVPEPARSIDVGYRARRLGFYMGRGSQEKHEIADRFLERANGLGLRLDIDADEESRIYGERWYSFLSQCRATLGVEAGVSVFDLDDSARERTERLLADQPDLDFDTVAALVLDEYEGRIPYRTVSPRHFEAAAFRVVQILYEGHYSGVLQPDVHYLPLAKDFSNFDEVIARFRDARFRSRVTDRAYDDLITSGRYSYAEFARHFDEHLLELGLQPTMPAAAQRDLERRLGRWRRTREFARLLRHRPFPGRRPLGAVYRLARKRSRPTAERD